MAIPGVEMQDATSAGATSASHDKMVTAPTSIEPSQAIVQFKSQRLRKLCKDNLAWSDTDIKKGITKHILPYLNHWKLTCYDDLLLQEMLNSLLSARAKRSVFRRKVLQLCRQHEGRFLDPSFFAALPAGPAKHVARTAVVIHLLCFSKVPDWTAAFALYEKGGYEIAVELVLAACMDLMRKGSSSWFHALLAVGPKVKPGDEKPGVKITGGGVHHDGKAGSGAKTEAVFELCFRKKGQSEPDGDAETEAIFELCIRTKERVDNPMVAEVYIKDKARGTTSKAKDARTDVKSVPSKKISPQTSLSTTLPQKKTDGRGSDRTRARNTRYREQRKLQRFEKVGLVPQDADLAALRQKQAVLKADREGTSERAIAKAARKAERNAEREEAEKRREEAEKRKEEREKQRQKLKVTMRFTGHRRDLLKDILSKGRHEAIKRNELAQRFPEYHGAREDMVDDAIERDVVEGDGVEDVKDEEMKDVTEDAVKNEKDCVLGTGCERKLFGRECVMCSAFGKV